MKINCFLLFLAARSRAQDNLDSGQQDKDHLITFQLNEITKNSKRIITEETIQVLQPLQPINAIYTGSYSGSDEGTTNEDPVKISKEEKQAVRELQREARKRPNRKIKTSKAPRIQKIKPTRAPKTRSSKPIRFKPSKASRKEKQTSTTMTALTAEVTFNDYDSSGNNSFYDNYYYGENYADVGSADYDYDYDYSNATLLDGSPRRKKPKFDFRVQSNECRVLPSNCNPDKFNFEKCTNDNKFIWQHKDKCKYMSTQDQAWRWKSVMCKCRKNKEDKKLKCSLETAFEYDPTTETTNAKNRTTKGGWRSFRRDNGRLDWRPISLATSCGTLH